MYEIQRILFKRRCKDSRPYATYLRPDDPKKKPIFLGYEESDASLKRRIIEAMKEPTHA